MPDFVLDHEPAGFARIKVIGVGGGGCNAVDSMFDIGLQNVEFYVINSDLQALKRSKCPNRIQIGAKLTQGRGCGAAPELGAQCMMDAKDEISETLTGSDIVFVTAGLGGGTGTGAAPVVAQIAREMGILTVGVVTKPFKFEGPRRLKSAMSGLERLREACDTLIVINNERLLDVVGHKVPMREAFKVADTVLAQAVSSINDLVSTPGLINVDFNDVRTIMGGRGGAVMGVGVGKGENRAHEAVKKATSSPLLDKIVIDGATGVLICITGGPEMTLAEVNEATAAVHEVADPDAEIIFGAVIDESLTDQLRVTIIATGFPDDVQRLQMLAHAMEPAPKANTAPPAAAAPVAPANGFRTASASAPQQAPVAPAAPVRAAAPAPQPAPALDESLDALPIFNDIIAAPAPQVAAPVAQVQPAAPVESPISGRPMPVQQPDSLRRRLEQMMQEQGSGGGQPPIRVAKSVPQPNGGNGNPVVRTAAPKQETVRAEEPAPQVSIFDPRQEQPTDTDQPAFLRRRRTMLD
jgi:cell division protein FtsZ